MNSRLDDKDMHKKDNNLSAAEYVLGILDADERARFQQALQDDAAVRDEVVYWEDQLAEVGLKLSPVTPPDTIWQQIQMQTGIRGTADEVPKETGGAGATRAWRLWAVAASLVAVSALSLLVVTQRENTADSTVVASVTAGEATIGQAAAQDDSFNPFEEALVWSSPKLGPKLGANSNATYISPDFVGKIQDYASSIGWKVAGYNALGAMEVSAAGKPYTQLWERATLELWLLPINSYEEPISLGLLPENGARRIPIPAHVASEFYTDYNKLAVSVEPPGGSLTGEPTGDILFITTLSRGTHPNP